MKNYIYKKNNKCYNIFGIYAIKGGFFVKKKVKHGKINISFIIFISLIILLVIFLSFKLINFGQNNMHTIDEEVQYYSSSSDEKDCIYLSDIEYDAKQSSVQWGSITLDSNLETQYNNGLITLRVDGKKTHFLKGISAHATSTLIYDLREYDYDYFSAYVGVDESRGSLGNGVKFKIYTSDNGTDWDLQKETGVLMPNGNAEHIKEISVKGVNYLKLYCDNNGSNASDHSVYADAKLYNEGYVDKTAEKVDFIDTVENYDKTLKGMDLDSQIKSGKLTEDTELVLLKRTFVNSVGYDLLQAIVNQNESYETAVRWLMSDIENLRLYVLGGEPDGGSYYNSIKELSRLYEKYNLDFEDKKLTNNKWYPDLTKGEVYKKMAISLSLTHATKVGYWAQIDHPSNRSDSLNRYSIYKQLYDKGKFVVSRNKDGTPKQDHTPWYEALTVEEMRYVMNNITDDEELIWLNEYTQKRIDDHPNEEEKYLQPHTYIAYVYPNYENPIFHDQTKFKEWDELFDNIFTKYHVTYSTEDDHVYKAWMSMRNSYGTGAVCGGIAKLGTHIRAAHGTPATVVGQPGHAALIYYRKNEDGKGYWTLDNDVSGWAQSGKAEKMGTRMPLGWGSDSYVNGYAATYMMLSQEALNDNENYEKSEKIIMLADLYKGDLKKQEEIYRKALDVQKINIDAWWGLINVYKADDQRKDKDYYELAEELGDALMPFPLPMKNLLDQIEVKITETEYKFKFTLLETSLLNEGKNLKDDTVKDPKTYKVLQPSITRTVANFLLGQTDTTLASFSFDGMNAGKIMLSSRFDGSGVRWDYNLSGKDSIKDLSSWNEVTSENEKKLTKREIESITADNDIYVHIVGTDYSDDNVYKIDIQGQSLPTNLYKNDLENRIIGVDLNTQWRYSTNDDWTSYSVESPNLAGNKSVQIRQAPQGTMLASPASEMYKFTEDDSTETRKYISVSNLSIKGYPENKDNEGYSSQSVDGARPFYAPNAIDGTPYTMWHTDFRYNVITQGIKPYIVVELNSPRYISALEFIQRKYKDNDPDYIKNATIYVSMDGENWTKEIKTDNYEKDVKLRSIDLAESVQAKYVKIELETYDMFASIAMLNLYEDTTKVDKTTPTADIYYSTKEKTSGYVIARLVNPSTEITITNNDGNDTYVFTKNGDFTFEFKDKNGNKGSSYAKVDWIDTDVPTADVTYKLEKGDRKLIILLDSISEDVYLLDKDDNKVCYVDVNGKEVSKISFLDSSENVYKTIELYEDEDGAQVTKTTYKNTTGSAKDVETYVITETTVTVKEGDTTEEKTTVKEEYFDENGNSIDAKEIKESDKDALGRLRQVKTNPLEYTFEDSGEYQYKLLDKASNIAYKSIKVDYLEDNNIIASDISYDITKLTNKNVVATINPYIISSEGKKTDAKITNNKTNKYTFTDNNKFTFKYKKASDNNEEEVEHTAEVNWIDKKAPTATIRYSTKEDTKEPVTATLVNESEKIIVTNNNTNRAYTFNDNHEFTFEFEDEAGNKGTALAKVDWISKEQEPEKEPEQKPDQEPEKDPEQDPSKNPEEQNKYEQGDINEDGKMTATDLLLIKRHLVAGKKQEWILKDSMFKLADINGDGKITATDLLLMKRLVLKQAEK